MKHFLKLPSVVQIVVAEVLMVTMLTPLVADIAYGLFQPESATVKTPVSWGDAAWFAIGLALLAWLVLAIFRPRTRRVSWVPVFGASGGVTWNRSWAASSALPDWKWYCDLDKFAPRPRWSLVVEGYPWGRRRR